jgi:hypothetical protein
MFSIGEHAGPLATLSLLWQHLAMLGFWTEKQEHEQKTSITN